MDDLKKIISEHAIEFEQYFAQTESLVLMVLDKDQIITANNAFLSKLLSTGEDMSGQSIFSFLLPESHGLLTPSKTSNIQPVLLNFKSIDSSPVPLHCHIANLDGGRRLIFGGHLMLTNELILQKMTIMSNEMANMARDLHKKNNELQEAHSKIKILAGIVPICMHCKQIRDDEGYWKQLESYITEHSEAQFSHGICDKCLEKYHPNLQPNDPG